MTDPTCGNRRARVLQLAYACSPLRGSEPGVGWNRAVEAAKYSDVWVIAEGIEFKSQVLGYLEDRGEAEGLHFVFVPKTRLEQRLSRIPGLYYPAYNLWHRRAFCVARQLHEKTRFDLVHQVNMSGFREPGYLWKLDVPFVWGPIGGTQNYPTRMLTQAGVLGAVREASRAMLNCLQLRFSRRVRKAARRASLVLAANTTVKRHFERALGRNTDVMSEIGTSVVTGQIGERQHGDALRLLWSGLFQVRKALPLLLKAMATLPDDVRVELRVLGDGGQRRPWQRASTRLGVHDRVEWLGWRPYAEALAQFAWADLFVFTSLRDTTGTVMLEAMANGVPVLAADHQGARDLVTPESGVKVKVGNPQETIESFRNGIVRLARDRLLLAQLACGARRRAEEFLWTRQGERMRDYYRGVLGDGYLWTKRRPEVPPDRGGVQSGEPDA
jgi:glycosyltransferase involved in cell wall biosynthesis